MAICPQCAGQGWRTHEDPFGSAPQREWCLVCNGDERGVSWRLALRWWIADRLEALTERIRPKRRGWCA